MKRIGFIISLLMVATCFSLSAQQVEIYQKGQKTVVNASDLKAGSLEQVDSIKMTGFWSNDDLQYLQRAMKPSSVNEKRKHLCGSQTKDMSTGKPLCCGKNTSTQTLQKRSNKESERQQRADSIRQSDEKKRIEAEHKLERQRKQCNAIIMVMAFIAILMIGFFHFRERKINKEKDEILLKKKNLETEHCLLRTQMSPHFILNAVDTIQHLITAKKIRESESYLAKFAQVFMYIIDCSLKRSILLSEEIKAISLYLDLEQIRLDQKFTYKIDVSDNVEEDLIGVPPMLIRPFVENAINSIQLHSTSGNGLITIKIDGHDNDTLKCSIIDNGICRMAATVYNQDQLEGMKLTRERLKDLNKPENVEKAYVVTDLEDETGNALGIKTTILMPIYGI